jgi:hypothetical protein
MYDRERRKKMKEKVLVLLGLIVCLLLIVGFATNGLSKPETVQGNASDQEESKHESQEISDIEITLNGYSVKEENEEELLVKVDLTIENKRESTVNFSLMNLTLMDSEHYAYSHESNVETKGILGGQISPGRSVSGEVAFIVPKDTSYELVYTDHFRTGQLFFPIEVTD